MSKRSCRFAGLFFSADKAELATEVNAFLRAAQEAAPAGAARPRAIVSPHAGYAYSGRFAGLSFATVTWAPTRIVVVSPSHRHAFRGIAFPSEDIFVNPLGLLRIDRAACAELEANDLAHEENAAHDNEHGIETQLPFISTLWPDALIVPLVFGDVSAEQVAAAIDTLEGPGTLVVLSSDLSHFLTQTAAREMDAETAYLLETGEAEKLTPYHACGAKGLQGWLMSRAGQESKALRLGMGDSAAVTGDRTQVVGYGAWAFFPIDAAMLNRNSQAELLGLARESIGRGLADGRERAISGQHAAPLETRAACFVTLTLGGILRGCIGSITAHRALAVDVAQNAKSAAFCDPRFSSVTSELLPELRIKVAVLSKGQEIRCADQEEALALIEPGRDGLILTSAGRRGLFLPAVWESLPDPREFLGALKQKAGLPPHYWANDMRLHRFRVESFGEPELAIKDLQISPKQ